MAPPIPLTSLIRNKWRLTEDGWMNGWRIYQFPALIFLRAHHVNILLRSSLPSPHFLGLRYISSVVRRLLSLDATINHDRWVSCLHWGIIICTICKLSGHDELAALNRPLLTDTDGGASARYTAPPANTPRKVNMSERERKWKEYSGTRWSLLLLLFFFCNLTTW